MCYESSSITSSNWNGAILGINREFNTSSYQGYINVVKIWNGIDMDLNALNQYYQNKNYWGDFGNVNIPTASV